MQHIPRRVVTGFQAQVVLAVVRVLPFLILVGCIDAG